MAKKKGGVQPVTQKRHDWERLFREYAIMGRTRSLRRLAKEQEISENYLMRRSAELDWKRRVREIDELSEKEAMVKLMNSQIITKEKAIITKAMAWNATVASTKRLHDKEELDPRQGIAVVNMAKTELGEATSVGKKDVTSGGERISSIVIEVKE